MFSADGTKATFLLVSLTAADTDASRLFNAMDIPVEIMEGKPTKRIVFDDAEGARGFLVLSVLCLSMWPPTALAL